MGIERGVGIGVEMMTVGGGGSGMVIGMKTGGDGGRRVRMNMTIKGRVVAGGRVMSEGRAVSMQREGVRVGERGSITMTTTMMTTVIMTRTGSGGGGEGMISTSEGLGGRRLGLDVLMVMLWLTTYDCFDFFLWFARFCIAFTLISLLLTLDMTTLDVC